MSTKIERAVGLYNEASLAEEQSNIDRAEVLYMESKEFFMQEAARISWMPPIS